MSDVLLKGVVVVSVRRWSPRLAVFWLVVAAAIGGSAGSAGAETGLAVEAGYGGFVQGGRPFPLRIEVTTDVLFVGELRISSRDSGLAIAKPVEIPGGTTRQLTVIWEGGPWGFGSATVQLVAGGKIVASATARPVEPRNVDLVGVFPALADRGIPERAPLLIDAGEAMLFAVDPAGLAAGWAALEPLDIVVVTAADLRGLDGAGLEALLGWVNRGGRLLVDEPAGAEVPGIPVRWQPDGAQPRMAGQGEIMLTNGRAASGRWDAMFEPAPTRSRQEDDVFGELLGGFWGSERLSSSLGRDAGVSLPSTRWLAAIIGAYIAVAGPVVWLFSRALRRPGLGWVLVPLVAVAFAAGIWVLGSSLRNSAKAAHGTVMEVAPGGTVATTYSLLHSGGGGRDSVSMPPGWSTVPTWTESQRNALDIVDDGAGSTASVRLDAGAFTVLGSSGAYPEFDDALRVRARSAHDGQVAGTVANNLPVDLHEVVVFADQAGMNIGTVPAGATVEFDYRGQMVDPFNDGRVEFRVWLSAVSPEVGFRPVRGGGRVVGAVGHEYNPGPVNLGLWSELTGRWSLNARQVGQVVVAAWSDEFASPLDAEVTAGRTLLVARAPIEPDGDSLTNLAVPREIVRGPRDLGSDFETVDRWGGGAMFRFVLPEDAGTGDLVLAVPQGQQRVDLWTGVDWRRVDLEAGTEAVFLLPPGSVDDGRVYVKVLFSFERGFPLLRDLAVRSRQGDDELVALSYAADDPPSSQPTESDLARAQPRVVE